MRLWRGRSRAQLLILAQVSVNLAVIGLVTTVQLVLHKACHLLTTETAPRARCIPLESEEKCLPGVPLLEGLAQALLCGIRHTAYGIRYTSCTSFSCQVPDMLSEKGLA